MVIKFEFREEYKEHKTKQKKGVIEVFNKFFEKEKFDIIIELGTRPGGLAIYLSEKAQKMNADFYTFDIRDINDKLKVMLKQNNGVFFKENANKNIKITNFVKSDSRVLILNDGDKFKSFMEYAPLLKCGDYMFIHDYYVDKKEIFDGLASYSDLKIGIKSFNLKISNYTEIFRHYLWLCLEKNGCNENIIVKS